MILTGTEIQRMVVQGRITIDPFDRDCLQPNSYDLHLSGVLSYYDLSKVRYLDPRQECPTVDMVIPGEGVLLEPGRVYLGSIIETVGSKEFVPRLEGKSSLGRLGVKVHLTAGFGDLGFVAPWTLEIEVTHPVRLYPGMRVCQVMFTSTLGDRTMQYEGKYVGQTGPTPSRM
jgi:dCTP deaminase